MEMLNGEVRDTEKVTRGLKKKDTPILTGYQIFHNYVRPHMGLDGQIPAERCGIKVEGVRAFSLDTGNTLLEI
jgi:putative transposase